MGSGELRQLRHAYFLQCFTLRNSRSLQPKPKTLHRKNPTTPRLLHDPELHRYRLLSGSGGLCVFLYVLSTMVFIVIVATTVRVFMVG